MNNNSKLIMIKTLHTLIWVFFNVVILYMLYAALFNKIGPGLWIGFCLVAAEGLVLVLFRFTCPLTIIARKYTDARQDNFDIYLPNWLARNTKKIYTTLSIIIALIVIFRILQH